MNSILKIVFLVIFLWGSAVCLQNNPPDNFSRGSFRQDQEAFHQALRWEALQKYDKAIESYRNLLEKDPANTRVYSQLKSLLRRIHQYEELEILIKGRLSLFPGDVQSFIELGEVYHLQGRESEALQHWATTLQKFSRSQAVYKLLMDMYEQYNYSVQLDSLVFQARGVFQNPSLFAMELGSFYSQKQNFRKATDEFITYAVHNPMGYQFVLSQIHRISDRPENLSLVEEQFLKRVSEGNRTVRLLYSDFLFKVRRYQDSFRQQEALGLENFSDVQRWLNFAKNLREEDEFGLALTGYSRVLAWLSKEANKTANGYQKLTGEALLGLALTYENQIMPSSELASIADYFPHNLFFETLFFYPDSLKKENTLQAFSLYDSVHSMLPGSLFSPQAHYRVGEIKFRIFHDFDGALRSYQFAKSLSRDSEQVRKSHERICDVFIAKGQMAEAQELLDELLNATSSYQDRIFFRMKKSHLQLLKGDGDSARVGLRNLMKESDISHDDFNDLFELISFIETHYLADDEKGKTAFLLYVRGELALRQAKLSEASRFFGEVLRQYPESPVADKAGFRRGKTELALGHIEESISQFMALRPSSVGDMATAMLGEIYDYYLNDKKQAIRWYLAVLEEHEESMLAEPVRKRIQNISKRES